MRTPFPPLSLYPELKELAGHAQAIADEIASQKEWFRWPSDAPSKESGTMCDFLQGGWTIFPLFFPKVPLLQIRIPGLMQLELEQLLEAVPHKFPQTLALLKTLPQLKFAALSRLHPHSELKPHRHVNPHSFIAHLGLIIPKSGDCALKVGTRVHHWKKTGDLVLFDDTYLHSAWNRSSEERIVLYLDLLKPTSLQLK
jgi:hypothetical protein